MIKPYNLDKVFGPVGFIAGYFIVVVGIAELFSSYKGLILIVLGAFIGFTSFATYVDFDKKRFRSVVNLFGIIPVGSWRCFDGSMQLSLKRSTTAWRTWSQSNRSFDVSEADYRLQLLSRQGKLIADLQRFSNFAKASEVLVLYSEKLGLGVKQHSGLQNIVSVGEGEG